MMAGSGEWIGEAEGRRGEQEEKKEREEKSVEGGGAEWRDGGGAGARDPESGTSVSSSECLSPVSAPQVTPTASQEPGRRRQNGRMGGRSRRGVRLHPPRRRRYYLQGVGHNIARWMLLVPHFHSRSRSRPRSSNAGNDPSPVHLTQSLNRDQPSNSTKTSLETDQDTECGSITNLHTPTGSTEGGASVSRRSGSCMGLGKR